MWTRDCFVRESCADLSPGTPGKGCKQVGRYKWHSFWDKPASMNRTRRWGWSRALALGILVLPCSVRALDPGKSVFQFNCQNWTRQNGLPADKISAITQTKDGFIWLGTQNGLFRFDGLEFTAMPIDLPQAPTQDIRSLSRSKDGELWFAINQGGFGGYDGRKFFPLVDDRWPQEGMNPTTIMAASDGAIWTAGDAGYGRWLKEKPAESFFLTAASNPGIVLSMCEDATGRIWLGTVEHGVSCWANGKYVRIPDDTLKKRNVSAIAADTNGNIWVGTGQGLLCYDAQGHPKQIPSFYTEVKTLLVDRQGVLWAGTSGMGVARFHNGTFSYLDKADGLASDYVTSLFEDAEGSLWVGTQEGLSQLTDVKFPIFSTHEGFTEGSCHNVIASHKGGIWATTVTGATYYDGTTATNYTNKSLLPNQYVKLAFEARNGDVYLVDGDKNINVMSGGQFSKRFVNEEWAAAFTEDDESVLVSIGPELKRIKNGELQPYVFKDGQGPPFYWITKMCVSRDGAIWVACNNGIFRIKDGGYQQWGTAEGLSWLKVQWICEDEDSSIWAGTGAGMVRIKNGQLKTITQANGLKDDRIYAIVPDDFGCFWISTGRGIMRAARASLNDFADGKTSRVDCELFEGLESIKFNDRTDQEFSGCKTKDGRIWFPNPQGVVMIDPRNYSTNALAPPVSIREIRVDGAELRDRSHVVLSARASRIEFLFSALSYISPKKVQIRYQLEGLEPDWVDAGTSRTAVYNKLRPGNYTFRVQACNADGVWNTVGDSFSMELPPPYYEAAWFVALCVLAGAVVLFGGFRWKVRLMVLRERKLRSENDKLEARVLERTKALAAANSSLHAEIDKREHLHRQLMDASRRAGMAEVATGVLHNVGNVLNSVNTSAGVLSEHLRSSKVTGVARVSEMLEEHKGDLGNFFAQADRGPRLIDYLKMLSIHLADDQSVVLKELHELTRNIDHIKEIVAMQQNYAKAAGVVERLSVTLLVEDALRMHTGALARHSVRVVKEFQEVPEIEVDKHKVIQILINLISNAKYAVDSAADGKILTVGIRRSGDDRILIFVRDNGMGVTQENLTRIFAHGFTTRKTGHGFGLHSGALAAKEMGGSLIVESEGPGKGATFTLELPLQPPAQGATNFFVKEESRTEELAKHA
jgi:ligand-binding sensor domain-containing protein/signal transduction histidine kinase